MRPAVAKAKMRVARLRRAVAATALSLVNGAFVESRGAGRATRKGWWIVAGDDMHDLRICLQSLADAEAQYATLACGIGVANVAQRARGARKGT